MAASTWTAPSAAAGYARAILESAQCTLWAIDRDPEAIERGASLIARFPDRLHLLHGQFGDMVALLAQEGVSELDGVVLDLGVSSFQIDDPARGFSFRHDGPLDMRMGKHGTSAADLVNTLPERAWPTWLYELGEERGLAPHRPCHRRRPPGGADRDHRPAGGDHPFGAAAGPLRQPSATRSFQALRIKVNDELGSDRGGPGAGGQLAGAGRAAVVVAFHSLEDRIVKRFMTEAAGRTGHPRAHDPAGLKTRDAPQFSSANRSGAPPRRRRIRPEPAFPQRQAACPRTSRQRPRPMIRPITIVAFLLACGSGLYLYQSKHEVQLLDRTIEKTVRDTTALREQSRLLAAEWTMLNDPDRLRQFSDTYLSLKSINPAQFTSLAGARQQAAGAAGRNARSGPGAGGRADRRTGRTANRGRPG